MLGKCTYFNVLMPSLLAYILARFYAHVRVMNRKMKMEVFSKERGQCHVECCGVLCSAKGTTTL